MGVVARVDGNTADSAPRRTDTSLVPRPLLRCKDANIARALGPLDGDLGETGHAGQRFDAYSWRSASITFTPRALTAGTRQTGSPIAAKRVADPASAHGSAGVTSNSNALNIRPSAIAATIPNATPAAITRAHRETVRIPPSPPISFAFGSVDCRRGCVQASRDGHASIASRHESHTRFRRVAAERLVFRLRSTRLPLVALGTNPTLLRQITPPDSFDFLATTVRQFLSANFSILTRFASDSALPCAEMARSDISIVILTLTDLPFNLRGGQQSEV